MLRDFSRKMLDEQVSLAKDKRSIAHNRFLQIFNDRDVGVCEGSYLRSESLPRDCDVRINWCCADWRDVVSEVPEVSSGKVAIKADQSGVSELMNVCNSIFHCLPSSIAYWRISWNWCSLPLRQWKLSKEAEAVLKFGLFDMLS